ncbi:MAG TPA: carboxypeptidase-like regulatory domain-containing protein, partial [Flavisolibacter sp.]|nr:carboxypeptidase-like regulatory domain-containing protein [Flavisolibacter sp.]
MKNLLLLIFLGGASLVANAQKKLLQTIYHPQISKGSIDDFLQDLSLNSGVVLEYSSGSFEPGKTVQLEGNENTIGAVLQIVLNGQKVKLLEHNDKIILAPSTETFNIDNFLPVRYSFFGYLREEASNEPLISATIYEPASQRGVVSNNLGYFNLLLPVGKHTVEISYGGLQTIILDLDIHGNLRKDVSLSV